MSYYTKKQIKDFIESKNEEVSNFGLKPLTPIEQPISQLEKEEDLVGFFWISFVEDETPGNRIKLEGKTFIRIDLDLYTDDRFALDLYHAQIEKKTISEVIKQRKIESEETQTQSIDKAKLEEMFLQKIKKEGNGNT